MNRVIRIATALDTLQIVKNGFYVNAANRKVDFSADLRFSTQASILYTPDAFGPVYQQRDSVLVGGLHYPTRFEVVNETSLSACERLSAQHSKVLCLNFASAKNPGGGFLNGSQAQEESLARSSALYSCIVQMKAMYDFHARSRTCLYSDHMIYSPEVPVFRKDDGTLLDDYYKVSFLTSPAVNAGAVRDREPENISKINAVLSARLEKILSIAVARGHTALVLGAWGCGVFRNDPAEVAEIFAFHLLENQTFKGAFEKVVFAVLDNSQDFGTMKPFREKFG